MSTYTQLFQRNPDRPFRACQSIHRRICADPMNPDPMNAHVGPVAQHHESIHRQLARPDEPPSP